MKRLLVSTAVVVAVAGSVWAFGPHATALSKLLGEGKSWDETVKMIPDIAKDLKEGQFIGCSKEEAGKYTLVYRSDKQPLSELSGKALENTQKMFKAVEGKKVGEHVEVSFQSEQEGGKMVDMKAEAMSAGNGIVCAVVWPANAKKEEAKKEEPKKAETTVAPAQPAAEAKPAEAVIAPAQPAAEVKKEEANKPAEANVAPAQTAAAK